MYYIYKYTNSKNGKVYIGQTSKTLEERAQANGRNYRECRLFYSAIKKYSWESFYPEILETVDTVEEANEREMYYIALYRSTDRKYGYNLLPGGNNKTMLPESRKIISDKAKERYKDKTANPMYGRTHSQDTKMKQSIKKTGENNPMYGSHWTNTQRERSGTRGKHLDLTDEQRSALRERYRRIGKTTGLRRVRCIEDDVIFNSVTEAASTYGVKNSTLCGHLRGRQQTCCRKHFEYLN